MDPVHRAVLRRNTRFLSAELQVSDSIVPLLFQDEILTEAQVEHIESQTTNRRKTLRLLELLPRRGPRAFRCFLRALDDFSWVRDRLLLDLHTPGPGAGPGAGAGPGDGAGAGPGPGPGDGPGAGPGDGPGDGPGAGSGAGPGAGAGAGPGAGPGPGPGAGSTGDQQLPASVLQRVPSDRELPASVLQRVPSDRELSRLASGLGPDWELVLMDLGLSAEALFRCRADHALSAHGAALAGLVQWRRSGGRSARVHRLLEALQAADVHPSVLQDALT